MCSSFRVLYEITTEQKRSCWTSSISTLFKNTALPFKESGDSNKLLVDLGPCWWGQHLSVLLDEGLPHRWVNCNVSLKMKVRFLSFILIIGGEEVEWLACRSHILEDAGLHHAHCHKLGFFHHHQVTTCVGIKTIYEHSVLKERIKDENWGAAWVKQDGISVNIWLHHYKVKQTIRPHQESLLVPSVKKKKRKVKFRNNHISQV